MNSGLVLGLMSFLFLLFGYLGVPVPFALMAGVLVGASFTQVSHIAIIQKMFDGMDVEALLANPAVRKFVDWVANKDPDFTATIAKKQR